jgi:endonuclease/exonuclease/phosphatase family metal-dependent hydrolase
MEKRIHHARYRAHKRRIINFGKSLKIFIPKRFRSSIAGWVKRVLAVMQPSIHIRSSQVPRVIFHLPADHLTVLSANLWHDWPFRRNLPHRLEAFARLVEAENADVVLLQEVIRTPDFSADEWLADRLGMAYAYSRVNGDQGAIGFEEGLAIFSRHPILNPETKHLGFKSGVTRRLALSSEVRSHLGNLLAISVHLGFLKNRNRSQLSDLSAWVRNITEGRTALIGGDFNAHETSKQINQAQRSWIDTFRSIHPDADGTTFELRWPWGKSIFRRRFDYIFLQQGFANWQVVEARHIGTKDIPHSDHSVVVARIKPHH